MAKTGNSEISATNAFDSPGQILLVCADAESAKALSDPLERALHQVTLITRGADVISTIQKKTPDLILCTLALNDLDGYEVCRRIKAHPEFQFIPFLLVGGAKETEAQVRGFEAGANDFITLPINVTLVAARVRSLLKYRRAVSALRKAQGDLEKRVAERTVQLVTANSRLEAQIAERSRAEQTLKTVLTGARCLLWKARVTRKGGEYAWKFDLFSFEALQRAFQIKFLPGHDDGDLWGGHLPSEECSRMYINSCGAFETGQKGYLQEFHVTGGDGTLHYLHEDVQIVQIEPEVWDLVGVVVDVSERKRAEMVLRDVIGSARCIVWYARVAQVGDDAFDWTLHIHASENMRRELGIETKPGETQTQMWGRLLRAGGMDQLAEMDRISHAAMRERLPHYQQEFALRATDGSVRWLTESVEVTSLGAKEWNLVGVDTDITERKRAEQSLRAVLDGARCVLWKARVSASGPDNYSWTFEDFSFENMRRFLKLDKGYQTGRHNIWGRHRPADQTQKMDANYKKALKAGMRGYQQEFYVVDGKNQKRWLNEDVEIYPISPGEYDLIGVIVDITARKSAEEELQQTNARLLASEERYALAAEGANDGLFDWNLKTQEIYFSPRWKAMIGCGGDVIDNKPQEWFKRVHPEDLESLRTELDAHLESDAAHFQKEYRMQHKEGAYRWMLARGIAVRDASGKPYRMVGSQTDITSRKTAELQVLHDAFHDILTGMPNRALFMDRLGQSMQKVLRSDSYYYGVLFLAIDRFDVVNDSLGHKSGDRLLMDIAHRLLKAVRPGDTVARLGGAEFAVLLDDTKSPSLSEEEATRIQQEFSRPFIVGAQEVFVSASIGVALSNKSYSHAEEVLRDADTAMRRAKAMGNRYLVFNASMHSKVVSVLQLGTDLRWAVDRQEFVLYYQPIISLETGKLNGLEALIRWKKPTGELVPPNDFIPLAEENGLIVPMTWWVLNEACRQMRSWRLSPHANGLSFVNVNLSSKMFLEPSLVSRIKHTLEETGLDGHCLKLEITESALMEHTDAAASVLKKLRDLNIQLCLDDFGTGYSSLSYLHRFPLDVLKIDRSFVSHMGNGGGNTEIVRTIVMLAQNLKLDTVAEGVETEVHAEKLKDFECKYAQGYLYSKPVPAEMLTEMLKSHKRW
jgi:diguanylate cyclase (GGDEF)-like protein/PAS domain S-box-containing protein